MQNALTPVERKLLGVLIVMSKSDGIVTDFMENIVKKMGYRGTGGSTTYALQGLQMKNHIAIEHIPKRYSREKWRIKVLTV